MKSQETLENDKIGILFVDDERNILQTYRRELFSETYDKFYAEDCNGALEILEKERISVIVTDLNMPIMNGLELLKIVKKKYPDIIRIIVTGVVDVRSILKSIHEGETHRYITKPIKFKEELIPTIRQAIDLSKLKLENKKYHKFLKTHNEILNIKVKEKTAELQSALKKLDIAHQKTKNSYIETIQRLTIAAEYKDQETGDHIKRVSYLCQCLAKKLGMDDEFTQNIFFSSPMHDIGKVAIPDQIIFKKGLLSEQEFDIVKKHTIYGAKIIGESSHPLLKMAKEIALTHHEKWDGSGYPNGLSGEDIPIAGRIMNMADIYDALRTKRPYKPSLDHKTTMKIFRDGDNRTNPSHFDPQLFEAFKEINLKLKNIYENRVLS